MRGQKGALKHNLLVIVGLAAVCAALAWWFLRTDRGSREIDRIVSQDRDSLAANQARVDTLIERSSSRDSSIRRDSIFERQLELQSRAARIRLRQLADSLRMAAKNAVDSIGIYIQRDTFHSNRAKADSLRIAYLARQRDSLKIDRNEWRRSTLRLLQENRRITNDLIAVKNLAKNSCELLFIHVRCPEIVVGPSLGVSAQGSFHAQPLAVSVGIPLRLGGKKAPSPRQPVRVLPDSALPVVSDLER